MNIREFITKLQNLPEKQKKIILWAIVVILGLIMGYFWINGAMNNLQKLGENVSQIKLPEIQTQSDENNKNLNDLSVQNQQATEGWKIYTNTEYGFEIKYPSDWYFREIEQGIIEGGIYFSPEKPDESETGGIVFTNKALSIILATSQKSLLQFAENYLNLSIVDKFEIENVKIGEENGIKIKVNCEGVSCGGPKWFIKKTEKVYIFNPNFSDKIDILEKMLSTFKFTK